jgi:hypothetical protein
MFLNYRIRCTETIQSEEMMSDMVMKAMYIEITVVFLYHVLAEPVSGFG